MCGYQGYMGFVARSTYLRMHYGPGSGKVSEEIFHTLFTSPKLPVPLKQLSLVCAIKGAKITVFA